MTITLTPEIERALTERASRQGTTPEQLALHDLTTLYTTSQPLHSIMELYGIGRGTWEGVDVQQYINEMRDKWDR